MESGACERLLSTGAQGVPGPALLRPGYTIINIYLSESLYSLLIPPPVHVLIEVRAFLPDTLSSGRCMRRPPDPAEAAGLHGSYTTLSAPISACASTDCRRQPRQIGSSAVTICHDSTKDKRTKVRVLMPDTHGSGRCTDCPPLALRGRNSWAKSNHGG